jgi:hypothetical protein
MMADPPRRLVLHATGPAVLVGAVGGCSARPAAVADRRLELTLNEYRIDPQSVSTGPGRLTIVVRNRARRAHNLVLKLGARQYAATAPVWPGRSTRLTVKLAAGTYVMASTILSDQALGTYGTLTVQ